MESVSIDLEKLRKTICRLTLEAGVKIMKIYNNGFEISKKDDQTPLTTADIASNRIITSGLESVSPLFPIISEESIPASFTERVSWQTYWLVDPLDGTKQFIRHNGEFTVNIALIQNNRPVIGVIHAPAKDVTYYACRGKGAFRLDHKKRLQQIHVRHLQKDKPTVVGSRSHATSEMNAFLEELYAYEFIQRGSSLKFCMVAEGTADLYARFGPTSEWDSAAGQCIVEEAGGLVTDTRMKPLRYNTGTSILNPNFIAFGDKEKDWSVYESLK